MIIIIVLFFNNFVVVGVGGCDWKLWFIWEETQRELKRERKLDKTLTTIRIQICKNQKKNQYEFLANSPIKQIFPNLLMSDVLNMNVGKVTKKIKVLTVKQVTSLGIRSTILTTALFNSFYCWLVIFLINFTLWLFRLS